MFYVALVPGAHRQGGEVAAPRRGAKGAKANADQSREGLPEKEEKKRRLTDLCTLIKFRENMTSKINECTGHKCHTLKITALDTMMFFKNSFNKLVLAAEKKTFTFLCALNPNNFTFCCVLIHINSLPFFCMI